MSNLNDSAIPVVGEPMGGNYGLTKHEWAAVIIGAHMVTGITEGLTSIEREIIGDEAYLLAKDILNKFNPTQQ